MQKIFIFILSDTEKRLKIKLYKNQIVTDLNRVS